MTLLFRSTRRPSTPSRRVPVRRASGLSSRNWNRACLLAIDTVTLLTDTTAAASPGELRTTIANATAGDTVVFQPGLTGTINLTAVLGPLSIGKNLTITGPGANAIAISGQNAIADFVIGGAFTVTISSLTITAGMAATGGGIAATGGTLSLQNCVLSGNTANLGGAVATSGNLNLQSSVLSGNSATGALGKGGAIYCANGSNSLTVYGCTFSADSTNGSNGAGGAIWCTSAITLIQNSTLSGCASGDQGGAIEAGPLTVQGCDLSGNTAQFGGAIFGFSTLVQNSTLSGNMAGGNGGAIYGGASFVNCALLSNTAGNSGGVIFGRGAATVSVSNSVMTGNVAGIAGGAIYGGPNGPTTVQNSTLSGNSAARGGGIFSSYRSRMAIQTSTFFQDSASVAGGAIYNVGLNNGTTISVADSTLSGNSANA